MQPTPIGVLADVAFPLPLDVPLQTKTDRRALYDGLFVLLTLSSGVGLLK